jgi:hypothetical protein
LDHLNDNNIISKCQFGFRENLGPDNAIHCLISRILDALNKKMQVSGIFCDLEKAFDCVSHEILLNKLRYYGIKDKQYNLYQSYLLNREQRTAISNGLDSSVINSRWARITNGVPQGSILGPLLFIIYINDLPKILEEKSTPILFADDACALISHANSTKFKTTINEIYLILGDWFKKNLMSLNKIKTCYINFTAKISGDRDMGEFGRIISSANHIKFLGLTIQNDITWDGHIQVINKKLNTACYMIRNLKQMVSMKTLKSVYFSYFHSVMTYGIMFWGNSPHAEKVFKLQKRAVRIMKGCGPRDSCRKYFRDLSILPLRSQYIYSLMIFVVKIKKCLIQTTFTMK